MATTPDEWLPILTQRLDARQSSIRTNRRYANGDAPMPEMGQNVRESWKAFQKKARTNLGGTLCDSVAGRIVPVGVEVGDSSDGELVAAARRVWRNNRLDVVFPDAVWNALSTRVGYLVVGTRDGAPIITSEDPEQVITAPDPAQPWRARAALKAWRDLDADRDFAIVWAAGVKKTWSRKSTNDNGTPRSTAVGDWDEALEETFVGPVPVYALENAHGVAEFEPHIDLIDSINLGKLQRLVITAMQAFKQRAVKGGLPDQDEEGNDIDWAKVFDPAPGALWDLPEGIDIWESQQTDIRPLLDGEKADFRNFAAVTRTPIDVFLPENQSATGAANAHKGEIQKAKDRIARFGAPMEAALLNALQIVGMDTEQTVQVLFANPEHVSLGEKTAAAAAAKNAGMSRRWISQNIMGMTPDEIARNETDLAEEMLSAAILVGANSGNANA